MTDHGGDGRADPVRVVPVHSMAGRLRLKMLERPSQADAEALADRLSALGGIGKVTVRPRTGSIIVGFEGPAEPMLARLKEAGLVRLVKPPKSPPVKPLLQMGMLKLDMDIRRRTDDVLDFHTAVALLLLAAALFQITQGRLVGPASTLLMSALALMERQR
ncbi:MULTISPECIES: HMA2 domain-containing protein [unclassified Roseitalea]|uniref:HMA2 domain-containing protein n=1 Tax=unclassified Roseitalea TaxID=2639107 RepID=UPI00273E0ED1|nr:MULTISPECIES: hypothetical protein [unclassified Roseitalea]